MQVNGICIIQYYMYTVGIILAIAVLKGMIVLSLITFKTLQTMYGIYWFYNDI